MTWNEEIAASLAQAVDTAFNEGELQVAAAAIDTDGTTIRYGRHPVAADSRFEIGSVTKTLTGTLLALLAAEGTLRLDDEIGRWLAAGDNGRITLLALATHTSGLPRVGPDLTPGIAEAELQQVKLVPGGYAYSNFGFQLLGLVLERASEIPYQGLLASRLLEPLAMTCSGTGSAACGRRIAGHAWGERMLAQHHPLPASGGAEATIGDLASFVRACLEPPPTPLGRAIAATQVPRFAIDQANAQALGWHIRDGRFRWHDGGTSGFSAAVVLDPAQHRGVAILINTSGTGLLITRAALLVLAGRDPGGAFPVAPPGCTDRARQVTLSLLHGRVAEAHASLSPQLRGRISAGRLERLWWIHTLDARGPAQVTVASQPSDEGLIAVAAITFASATRGLTVRFRFDPAAQITDLRIKRSP